MLKGFICFDGSFLQSLLLLVNLNSQLGELLAAVGVEVGFKTRETSASTDELGVCNQVTGPRRPYDVIIRNGRIIDGTGNPWFSGDLGIRDGRIANFVNWTKGKLLGPDGKPVSANPLGKFLGQAFAQLQLDQLEVICVQQVAQPAGILRRSEAEDDVPEGVVRSPTPPGRT